MVREQEIGRPELTQGGRVRLDVRPALLVREVLQQPRLEPFVAVEDERGQQPARQLRSHDARAAEVELLGMTLLADDRHVVPRAAPFPGQSARVDVRARPSKEVPVPQQDPQALRSSTDRKPIPSRGLGVCMKLVRTVLILLVLAFCGGSVALALPAAAKENGGTTTTVTTSDDDAATDEDAAADDDVATDDDGALDDGALDDGDISIDEDVDEAPSLRRRRGRQRARHRLRGRRRHPDRGRRRRDRRGRRGRHGRRRRRE